MCNHHKNHKDQFHGSSIEHGEAHAKDHKNWNRRQFLSMGGLFAAGSLLLRNTPVTSLIPNAFTNALNSVNSDNILVLVRLFGGNDGLNTIIPHTLYRSQYEAYRPVMKLRHNIHYGDNQILTGYNHSLGADSNNEFAMPYEMDPLMQLWSDNKMSVLHNVGYQSGNLSHFVSTDYWSSGTNTTSDDLFASGWMGRYLNGEFPDFGDTILNDPPAILLGVSSDLTFINCAGENMGLTFPDVQSFNDLVDNEGLSFSNTGIGNACANDRERRFLRDVARSGDNYSNNVYSAYQAGGATPYSTATDLSNKLNIVAKLIKGGLSTRIYMVTLDGFDFHVGQMGNHQALLGDLSNSVRDFFDDLTAANQGQRVMAMAYSEFGRTILDNTTGTDHGTLNNVMLFGEGLSGGFHGTPMNLADPGIQSQHRVFFESDHQEAIDFRDVYSTILRDWLGVDVSDPDCPTTDTGYIPDLFENVLNPGCPTTEVLNNGVDDYNSETGTVRVQNTIIATNVVNASSDIKYDAGQHIDLNAGFEVKQGAEFDAVIGGCTSPMPSPNQSAKIKTSKNQKQAKIKQDN